MAKNYSNKEIDEIDTVKDWSEFEDAFDTAKEDGNSDLDAIEWAK